MTVVIHPEHLATSTANFDEQTLVVSDTKEACSRGIDPPDKGPPMAFLVTTSGHTYRAQSKHTCSVESPTGSAENLAFYNMNGRWVVNESDGRFPGWVVDPIAPEVGPNGAQQSFSWRLYEGGGRLASGRFIVTYRISGGTRTIWEGTDDFINICINQTKQIRSSGGRLYCSSGKPTNISTITIK